MTSENPQIHKQQHSEYFNMLLSVFEEYSLL